MLVPTSRLLRWCENFQARHGDTAYALWNGTLSATARDGTTAELRLPFDRPYDGPPDPQALAGAAGPPASWGVLLVRKGGFAVGRLEEDRLVEHKVGTRHVQGRTKAGGQSQQRFARRRDNQARAAYDAAADHAARILAATSGSGGAVQALVTGGDRAAVAAVLADVRLAPLTDRLVDRWLPVPDPRRAVLDAAVAAAQSVEISITDS